MRLFVRDHVPLVGFSLVQMLVILLICCCGSIVSGMLDGGTTYDSYE